MLEGLGTQIERDGLLDKYRKPEDKALCTEEWSSLTKKFLAAIPYTLTPSQLRAVSEIIWDLKRPVPGEDFFSIYSRSTCSYVCNQK